MYFFKQALPTVLLPLRWHVLYDTLESKYSIQAPFLLHKLPLGMFFYFWSSFMLHL